MEKKDMMSKWTGVQKENFQPDRKELLIRTKQNKTRTCRNKTII